MQLVDSSTNIVYNLLINLRLQNLSGEEDRVGYKGSEEANFLMTDRAKSWRNKLDKAFCILRSTKVFRSIKNRRKNEHDKKYQNW